MPPHHDEADQVRDARIVSLEARLDRNDRFLRWVLALALGAMLIGALAAILGGPAAVQAFQTLHALVPATP